MQKPCESEAKGKKNAYIKYFLIKRSSLNAYMPVPPIPVTNIYELRAVDLPLIPSGAMSYYRRQVEFRQSFLEL